ncbi:MAG: (E)-4-hydroxy-3-methylbut-2-enyl-diphosphate synthase [Bacteroidales bacterium]
MNSFDQNSSLIWNPRPVKIGNVVIGGSEPVSVQSMTNTSTSDIRATAEQCKRLAEAGCALVRITARNHREAENLADIKKELRDAGINIPLIADVHFSPSVAEIAAGLVEKVRINPGNFVDKRQAKFQYSESEYNAELSRIYERLKPLLDICRQNSTAIRIGVNHGSLSGRIMQRYGDTPAGMAESAMEFVRMCHNAGFHQLVLSMKASNVRVMVAATRLLVQKMIAEQMQYPIHLGVTEAGNGLEGRIKSAAGIGTLLADGIGNTIRVSLTEAPENEIPVAREIISFFEEAKTSNSSIIFNTDVFTDASLIDYRRRHSRAIGSIGGGNVPVVLWGKTEVCTINEDLVPEGNEGKIITGEKADHSQQGISYMLLDPLVPEVMDFLKTQETNSGKFIPVFTISNLASIHKTREIINSMGRTNSELPVLLSFTEDDKDIYRFAIRSAIRLAPLLNDGLCDGIYLRNNKTDEQTLAKIAFGILQATRSRITQTEYIACPGCGRTQYDLETALERVKRATSHLKGLKIAVMGCIVNGPGEMADADFGYVGEGNGRVALYKGHTLVKKNIAEQDAVDELINLLKSENQWKEAL